MPLIYPVGFLGGSGPVTLGWNQASDGNSVFTVSGIASQIATPGSSTGAGIASKTGHASGKWYFECVNSNKATNETIGVTNATTLFGMPGQFSTDWGYQTFSDYLHNNSSSGSPPTWTSGDVIGVAVDVGAGLIWFAKNNTFQGSPSGGTGSAFSGLSGTLYASAGSQSSGKTLTLQNVLTYIPPSGFSAWG